MRAVCGPGSVSTLSSRAPFPEAPLAAGGVFSWATCPHLNSGASQFPFQSRRGHQKANRPCPRPGFIRKLSDVRNWQRRPPILWSGLSWRNSADCGSRSPRRKRARMSGGRRRRSRRAHPHGLHQRGCELSGAAGHVMHQSSPRRAPHRRASAPRARRLVVPPRPPEVVRRQRHERDHGRAHQSACLNLASHHDRRGPPASGAGHYAVNFDSN